MKKRELFVFVLFIFLFTTNKGYSREIVKGGYTRCITSIYSTNEDGKVNFDSLFAKFHIQYNTDGKKISETRNKIEKSGMGIGKQILKNKVSTTYTDNGSIDKYSEYNNDGTLDYSQISKYDIKGNNIEDLLYNSSGKLVQTIKTIYTYDSRGNLIEEIEDTKIYGTGKGDDSSYVTKTIYENNKDGKLVEFTKYRPENNIIRKGKKAYDSNGNKIEESTYTPKNSMIDKSTYKYNAKGDMIEAIFYNGEGSFDYKHACKYDSYGNLIETILYNQSGKPFEIWNSVYSK